MPFSVLTRVLAAGQVSPALMTRGDLIAELAASQPHLRQAEFRALITFALATAFSHLAGAATLSEGTVGFDHTTVVTITGEIVPGDDRRLLDIVTASAKSGYPVSQIELDSLGGNLSTAERIADYVFRHPDISTSIFVGDTCASACSLIFFAGELRAIFDNGRLGVHRASTGNGTETAETLQVSQRMAGRLTAYGAPPAVARMLLGTPPSRVTWIDPAIADNRLSWIAGIGHRR